VAVAPAATSQPPEVVSEETRLRLRIAEAERAKAEAELARAKAEAGAAKQRERSERKEAVAASSAAITASPVPVAASPGAVAAAPAPIWRPVGGARTATSDHSAAAAAPVISTRGTAVRFCDAWEDLKAFNDQIPARLADGEIVIERGEPGQPGFLRMTGRPT